MYASHYALLLGLMAMLISGCVSLDFRQKVERNGDSVFTESIDLSTLLSAGSQYGADEAVLSKTCENITAKDSAINCSYDGGVITISKKVAAQDGGYMFNRSSEFPYVVYTLEVRKVPQFVESDTFSSAPAGATDTDFKSPSAKLTAATMKTAGASISYKVEMPGELVSAENGDIVKNEDGIAYAEYDVLGLMSEGEYIVVKSREYDVLMLGIAAGAAVLLIGGIAVAIVLMKAMKR